MKARRAFTLFELVLALAVLMLISGGVFSLTAAALETAKNARTEQTASRRLEAFLRVARRMFLHLDARGTLSLRMGRSGSASVPEMIFDGASGAFDGAGAAAPSSFALAALPEAGGARTFAFRRIPADGGEAAPWTPLLAGAERVRWTFFSGGSWSEEWPEGRGRPELVRLNFIWRGLPGPVEAIFWLPPATGAAAASPAS